jgi:hypothetical protein
VLLLSRVAVVLEPVDESVPTPGKPLVCPPPVVREPVRVPVEPDPVEAPRHRPPERSNAERYNMNVTFSVGPARRQRAQKNTNTQHEHNTILWLETKTRK